MLDDLHRKPAVVPAPPPPPPPSQGPGFYPAAQKYTESEEKPTSSQLQSRSFKFLQGIMDSGQGKFYNPTRGKIQDNQIVPLNLKGSSVFIMCATKYYSHLHGQIND